MDITETLHLTDRDDWRKWLSKNHNKKKEIWLVYYKKSTGKQTFTYDESVEEALCFGWIDGIKKSIDEEKYTIRFTPRNPNSNWSESNIKRIKKLIKEGKMKKEGLAVYPKMT